MAEPRAHRRVWWDRIHADPRLALPSSRSPRGTSPRSATRRTTTTSRRSSTRSSTSSLKTTGSGSGLSSWATLVRCGSRPRRRRQPRCRRRRRPLKFYCRFCRFCIFCVSVSVSASVSQWDAARGSSPTGATRHSSDHGGGWWRRWRRGTWGGTVWTW